MEYRCLGVLDSGNQCRVEKNLNNLYCKTHYRQDPLKDRAECIRCGGFRVHWIRLDQMECKQCDKKWEV